MTIVVTLYSLLPFDASLNRVLFRRSLRLACLDPRHDPASWGHLAEAGLLHALLAGVVVRLARRRVGAVRSLLWSLGFTLILSAILESLQVCIKSQVAATFDVFGALAGGAAGAVLAIGLSTGRMCRYAWHAVVGFYAAGLVILRLHWLGAGGGTDLIEDRLGALVPIYGQYFDSNLAGIAQFVNLLLLFAPLGFLIVQRLPVKLPPAWRYIVVAIACGGWMVLLEFLDRMVSAGEIGFAGAIPAFLGGLVGATAWRWGERAALPSLRGAESGQSGHPGSAARPLPCVQVEPGLASSRMPVEM